MKRLFFTTSFALVFILASRHNLLAQSSSGGLRRITQLNHNNIKFSDGSRLSYQHNKLGIVYEDGKDPFIPLKNEIEKIEEDMAQTKAVLLQENLRNYPLVKQMEVQANQTLSIAKEVSSGEIEVNDAILKGVLDKSGFSDPVAGILNLYKKWEKIANNFREKDIQPLPKPPMFKVEEKDVCALCDTIYFKEYSNAETIFRKELFREERELISQFTIDLNNMAKLGLDPYNLEMDKGSIAFCESVSQSIFSALVDRMEKKTTSIVNTYGNDFHYLRVLLVMFLEQGRLEAFVSASQPPELNLNLMQIIKPMLPVLDKLNREFEAGMQAYDYRQFCRLSYISSLNKLLWISGKLYGIGSLAGDNWARDLTEWAYIKEDRLIESYLRWNKFKLSFEISFKAQHQEVSELEIEGKLKGETNISLFWDSDGKYWMGDFKEGAAPFVYNLEDVRFYLPDGVVKYSGSKKFSPFQGAYKKNLLKCNLCTSAVDSIFFLPFATENLKTNELDVATFKPGGNNNFKAGFWSFLVGLLSTTRLDKESSLYGGQKTISDALKASLSEERDIMYQYQIEYISKDEYDYKILRLQDKRNSLITKNLIAENGSFVYSVKLFNTGKVLLDQTFDLKVKNPQFGGDYQYKVDYLTAHIRLEHNEEQDPL